MKLTAVEWLEGLEIQTLTDELKSEIIERFQEDMENDIIQSTAINYHMFERNGTSHQCKICGQHEDKHYTK